MELSNDDLLKQVNYRLLMVAYYLLAAEWRVVARQTPLDYDTVQDATRIHELLKEKINQIEHL